MNSLSGSSCDSSKDRDYLRDENRPIPQFKKFEIQKDSNLTYNPTTNYYKEYWRMFYDNEYLLAQIRENSYEIKSMKAHIDQINKS